MDTDSMFLNEIGLERLKKKGLMDDIKLGKFKHEVNPDYVKGEIQIFGSKSYEMKTVHLTEEGEQV